MGWTVEYTRCKPGRNDCLSLTCVRNVRQSEATLLTSPGLLPLRVGEAHLRFCGRCTTMHRRPCRHTLMCECRDPPSKMGSTAFQGAVKITPQRPSKMGSTAFLLCSENHSTTTPSTTSRMDGEKECFRDSVCMSVCMSVRMSTCCCQPPKLKTQTMPDACVIHFPCLLNPQGTIVFHGGGGGAPK